MNPKAISFLIHFLIIYKKLFNNILYNQFKPENILKLSTSFTSMKPWVKYIKVGDNIELPTYENNSMAKKAKSITQLLQFFLIYR